MGRPLLFIDFDGVINQFPDDKVMRRQGENRLDETRRSAPRRVRAGQLVQAGTVGSGSWSATWDAGSSSGGTRSSWPDWTPWMRTNGG